MPTRNAIVRACRRSGAHRILERLDHVFMHRIARPGCLRFLATCQDDFEHLQGAERLAQQLTGWLCAHQLAVERITLLLEHERGRVARPPTAVEIALGEPSWRDEHLVRLLRERLAKTVLEATSSASP
jgi:hypothetical protein